MGAWGLTEANTGSDAGNMKCTAVKDGNDWVINGTKNWITHGKSGDVAVVIAEPVSHEQKIIQQHLLLKKEHRDLAPEKKKINWACVPVKPPK